MAQLKRVGVMTLGIVVGCLASCGWSGSARLRALDTLPANAWAEVFPRLTPGREITVGTMLLCVTGPGRARITSVDPVDPTGRMHVVGYGFRPRIDGRGGQVGDSWQSLEMLGFRDVADSVRCDSRASADELALELTKVSRSQAVAHGFEIHYVMNGKAASVFYPLTVGLCSTWKVGGPDCRSSAAIAGQG